MPGMDLEILGDMGDMGAFPPGFVRDHRGYPGAYAHPAYGPRPYAWSQPQYAQPQYAQPQYVQPQYGRPLPRPGYVYRDPYGDPVYVRPRGSMFPF